MKRLPRTPPLPLALSKFHQNLSRVYSSAHWTLAPLSLFLAICGSPSSPLTYWELPGRAPFDSSLCPPLQDPSKSQPGVAQKTLVHMRDPTHPCASKVLTGAEGWLITAWLQQSVLHSPSGCVNCCEILRKGKAESDS